MPNHPSSFNFPNERLVMTVYVDDLMLAGPCEHHEAIWTRLTEHIKLDPPDDLDRFLGRTHDVKNVAEDRTAAETG